MSPRSESIMVFWFGCKSLNNGNESGCGSMEWGMTLLSLDVTVRLIIGASISFWEYFKRSLSAYIINVVRRYLLLYTHTLENRFGCGSLRICFGVWPNSLIWINSARLCTQSVIVVISAAPSYVRGWNTDFRVSEHQARMDWLPLHTVVSLSSFLSLLFISKYEVNPLIYMIGHVITLQSLAMFLYKVTRIRCPDRQLRVSDTSAILFNSEINAFTIQQELTAGIKLWDELQKLFLVDLPCKHRNMRRLARREMLWNCDQIFFSLYLFQIRRIDEHVGPSLRNVRK